MTLCCPGANWFRLWSELVEREGKGERVGEARWSSGSELTGASWFWSELTCSLTVCLTLGLPLPDHKDFFQAAVYRYQHICQISVF